MTRNIPISDTNYNLFDPEMQAQVDELYKLRRVPPKKLGLDYNSFLRETGDRIYDAHFNTPEGRAYLGCMSSHGFAIVRNKSRFPKRLAEAQMVTMNHFKTAYFQYDNWGIAFDIAVRYWAGQGAKRNLQESLLWLKKSAADKNAHVVSRPEGGDARAQHFLGALSEHGKGCDQDTKKAVGLFKISAEKGNVLAQSRLSRAYDRGELNFRIDRKEASRYYEMLMVAGDMNAMNRRGELSRGAALPDHLTAFACFEDAVTEGRQLFARGMRVSPGSIKAFRNLAMYYDRGLIVRADMIKAAGLRLEARKIERAQANFAQRIADGIAKIPYHFTGYALQLTDSATTAYMQISEPVKAEVPKKLTAPIKRAGAQARTSIDNSVQYLLSALHPF